MRFQRVSSLALSALVLLLLPCARQAKSQSSADYVAEKGIDERFRLDLGGFAQKYKTTLRLDSAEYGRGTEVSLEDDLGLSSDQVNFRADGYWRFGRHGRLELGFMSWNRTSSHVIDRDIVIGDTTYHAGANLSSELTVRLIELYYSYSFWNTPKFEGGLMLGVSALSNQVSFEGAGTVTGGGGSSTGAFSRESRNLIIPVPAIGAQLRYTIIPKLLVSGKIRGFGATIDNFKGSVLEGRAALDYYPWKNVGFGAGYDYTDIKCERTTDPAIEFEYKYSGPVFYLSLVF